MAAFTLRTQSMKANLMYFGPQSVRGKAHPSRLHVAKLFTACTTYPQMKIFCDSLLTRFDVLMYCCDRKR